jgi:hypothetical protein
MTPDNDAEAGGRGASAIIYGVLTRTRNHHIVAAALLTFARTATDVFVATDNASQALQESLSSESGGAPLCRALRCTSFASLAVRVKLFETGCVEGPDLVCKTTFLLRKMVAERPRAHWFARVSDDCFFLPAHLERALGTFDPRRRIYAGDPYYKMRSTPGSIREQRYSREPHAAGGPLFVLSRPLALWFEAHAELFLEVLPSHIDKNATGSYNSDDVGLGAFFSMVANVPVTPLQGIMQEPSLSGTFHPPGSRELQHDGALRLRSDSIVACPCLPPATLRLPGKFMRLYPNRALEWADVIALHASAAAYPGLWATHLYHEGLKERSDTNGGSNTHPMPSGDPGRLLFYLRNFPHSGKTHLGSLHFTEASVGFCTLGASQRLAAWRLEGGCNLEEGRVQ